MLIRNTVLAIAIGALLLPTAALAAKPSVVTKLSGEVRVVNATSDSHYLAGWSRQPGGEYLMVVIDADNGATTELESAENPGGFCWVPRHEHLVYCYGFYNEKVDNTRVRYDLYSPVLEDSAKISDTLTDTTEMYVFDPVVAEDGTRVFHMLLDTTSLPNFVIYFPNSDFGSGVLTPRISEAVIGSEYDLSSDGTKVYWYGHNQDTDALMIIEWDLEQGNYSDIYDFSDVYDPAQDHALFKVDTPHSQAATLAFNDLEPTLQLCVYEFGNPGNLQVTPVHFSPNHDALNFDWKGRSGWLSVLVRDRGTGEFIIMEVEPITGQRRELLRTMDEISYFDYNPSKRTYYYSVVDNRDPRNPSSMIMRLEED